MYRTPPTTASQEECAPNPSRELLQQADLRLPAVKTHAIGGEPKETLAISSNRGNRASKDKIEADDRKLASPGLTAEQQQQQQQTSLGVESARETALLDHLLARGSMVNVRPGRRHDGVRGIFASRDLDAEEMACWVPEEETMQDGTCEPELLAVVDEVLSASPGSSTEKAVYRRMMALAVTFLVERGRGMRSRCATYMASLPEPPPTVNTFTSTEQELWRLLSGSDPLAMYRPLVGLVTACMQRVVGTAMSPDAVQQALFFILSRMSHLRLIPLVDLANASSPGHDNARILVDLTFRGRTGCAVVTKTAVKEGEELLIDYNHHDAVAMLGSYGCTLGMEHTRSVTRIQLSGAGLEETWQLLESEPCGLCEQALLFLRLASLGTQDFKTARETGLFEAPPHVQVNDENLRAKLASCYDDVRAFCKQRRQHWEAAVGRVVERDGRGSVAGSVLRVLCDQYETDRRLLLRCEETMQRWAACLVKGS